MALYLGSKKAVKSNYKGGVNASGVDATAGDVLYPKVIVDKNGVEHTGTILTKTSSDITVSGKTVTVPVGYYTSSVSKSVSTGALAEPTYSTSNGVITVKSKVGTSGYLTSGTVSSGTTISDSNLIAENIAEGVSIFGVTGTHSGNSGGGGYIGSAVSVQGNDEFYLEFPVSNINTLIGFTIIGIFNGFYFSGESPDYPICLGIVYYNGRISVSYIYDDGEIYGNDYTVEGANLNLIYSDDSISVDTSNGTELNFISNATYMLIPFYSN